MPAEFFGSTVYLEMVNGVALLCLDQGSATFLIGRAILALSSAYTYFIKDLLEKDGIIFLEISTYEILF